MQLMRIFLTLLVTMPLWAAAQPATGSTLQEVRIEGTTALRDVVRVVLSARQGSSIAGIDLEAERNRVYALGSFSEVSVSIEDAAEGPVMVVRVRENPPIESLRFRGVESLIPDRLRDFVERVNILSPGNVLNTSRARDAIGTIQSAYRQEGFPFAVPVTLELLPVAGETGEEVAVEFTVTENPPLEEVVVTGSTVFPQEQLTGLFDTLVSGGEFHLGLYENAVAAIAERYRSAGYRLSGVDPATTTLEGGLLQVRIVERRITDVNTSAIGIDPSELSLSTGDLFNYDVLLSDVRRLAAGRSSDVRLVTRPIGTGGVQVLFEVGPPETAGVITGIRIEGNTVISDEELAGLLGLHEGDTFTSTLAVEDFERIRGAYRKLGFMLLSEPDFNYLDGIYLQRVHEVRIAGSRVTFEAGEHRTKDFVITRYLPPAGEVMNENALRSAMIQLQRLGAVEPVTATYETTGEPEEIIVNVVVREANTGMFTPSAQYSTDAGFSMSVSYSEANLWGRAHNVGIELTGQTSEVGLMFGGSIRYSIPWLYLDFLDFQEVPTSLSVSVFSLVNTNRIMTSGSSLRVPYPGLPDTEGNQVLVGEYTQRDTGFSLALARPVFRNTRLGVSARAAHTTYLLEPPHVECTFDDAGELENAQRCSLPGSEAAQYLPQGGLGSFISSTLNYDNRDNPEFPRSGVAANALLGVGFGNDYRNPDTDEQQNYTYQQVEFGVKTYLQLSSIMPDHVSDPNHVLAFRVNFGHQFGDLYPYSKRFQVGKTTNEATSIRGYQAGDFSLSQTYATGSIEYRYDFGLSTVATQTVIGIVFVDVGYASAVPGFPDYQTPLYAGAGVGVQVNLGFGGVLLPALRFDYGFSQLHPGGEFRFRVGPVF
jgi:outer membrane protein insertion porin family